MGNLGFQELFVIFLIALVVIGPKRLPDLAKALGEAVRAFQEAMRSGSSDASSSEGDEQEPRRVSFREPDR